MPQAITSTTMVRMAVARLEFTPSMPIFARMDVSAANTADKSARTNHMDIRLDSSVWMAYFSKQNSMNLRISRSQKPHSCTASGSS